MAQVLGSSNVKKYHLFGRQKSVHDVLGGGTPADVFLWRNKKVSATALGVATIIWFLFEFLEYHLLTLLCHFLMFTLTALFVWSNVSSLIHKSPPRIPDIQIPEDVLGHFVTALGVDINTALELLRDIASGRHLIKFLKVTVGLWVVSKVGELSDFLTLVYLLFVILLSLPVFYEKYEKQIDGFAEKAQIKLRRQYAIVNEKFLSKIPRGPFKRKKTA